MARGTAARGAVMLTSARAGGGGGGALSITTNAMGSLPGVAATHLEVDPDLMLDLRRRDREVRAHAGREAQRGDAHGRDLTRGERDGDEGHRDVDRVRVVNLRPNQVAVRL